MNIQELVDSCGNGLISMKPWCAGRHKIIYAQPGRVVAYGSPICPCQREPGSCNFNIVERTWSRCGTMAALGQSATAANARIIGKVGAAQTNPGESENSSVRFGVTRVHQCGRAPSIISHGGGTGNEACRIEQLSLDLTHVAPLIYKVFTPTPL